MVNYLKKYRESAHLTQAQLACSVGCARETIANLERGKYNPSLAMAYAILNCINSQSCVGFDYEITDIFPNEEGEKL